MTDREIIFSGPRARLARLIWSDFRAIHRIATDARVIRFMTWGPNTEAQTRDFLAQSIDPAPGHHVFGVLVGSDVVGVGDIDARDNEPDSAEIGYNLHPDHWGRGLGTEVAKMLVRIGFDQLGLHRLWATCDPDNVASARVLENCGMRYTGILRSHLEVRGHPRDSLTFALTRA